MPVRFQVDGDFYDHPKSIGLSDAAVALWTRAGSYSAAKLTNGFIAEHVLALLSRTPTEAAEELVARGLWKRTKGGYRFHQWEDRGNLTKERVEADRNSDRQRKRRARQLEGQKTNTQVRAQIVQPESAPESEGNPDGIRGLSVSVSESVSESSSWPAQPEGERMPRKRGTRIPDPWIIDEPMKEWALKQGMQPQWVARHTERFINYWKGVPGQKGTKLDWRATWYNWLLKQQDDSTPATVTRLPREATLYASDDVRNRFK